MAEPSKAIDQPVNNAELESLERLTRAVYILHSLACMVGFTAVAGVIINYLTADQVQKTYLQSHYHWQIQTFWWTCAGLFIGLLGWFLWPAASLLCVAVLVVTLLWFIHRTVKGWLFLRAKQRI